MTKKRHKIKKDFMPNVLEAGIEPARALLPTGF